MPRRECHSCAPSNHLKRSTSRFLICGSTKTVSSPLLRRRRPPSAPVAEYEGDLDRVPVIFGPAVAQEALDHGAVAGEKGDRDGLHMGDGLLGLGLGISKQHAFVEAETGAEAGLQVAVLHLQRAAEEIEPLALDEGVDVAIVVGQAFDEDPGPRRLLDHFKQFLRHGAQDVDDAAKGQRADPASQKLVGGEGGGKSVEQRHRAPEGFGLSGSAAARAAMSGRATAKPRGGAANIWRAVRRRGAARSSPLRSNPTANGCLSRFANRRSVARRRRPGPARPAARGDP